MVCAQKVLQHQKQEQLQTTLKREAIATTRGAPANTTTSATAAATTDIATTAASDTKSSHETSMSIVTITMIVARTARNYK